jgi:hypothetical protein
MNMPAKKRDIVIAGYSETAIDFKTGRSAYDLGGEALAKLLAATGIPKDAIDGLSVTTPLSECPNPFFAVYMTEALGLTPTWLNYGGTGGCSATGGVARARSRWSCRLTPRAPRGAPITGPTVRSSRIRPAFKVRRRPLGC